jgi:hypothetical protein
VSSTDTDKIRSKALLDLMEKSRPCAVEVALLINGELWRMLGNEWVRVPPRRGDKLTTAVAKET